ncbi:SRPBCC family protein [Protofrankia symbiont of Coriaria ruscifolia]|uniref:SRPBCC family protein n=1 Tax=Protofrankia symbiont of Coriaria ruscifolia TaxID=1306542 RepID=UPI001041A3B3|nr:SRPBCC family protein [Protofrankia symbiont of Coriaria ruscifolia]
MAGHTENSIWIDADIDPVWTITNNLEGWPDLFTEYASVEILEHHDQTFKFRLTMHPDANGKIWSWVSQRTLDPDKHRVQAHRVEPGPFEFMNIEWTYEPEGTGTRMRWVQDFHMRPDAPVDDEWMTNNINNNTQREMSVIRDKVERAAQSAKALPQQV